MKSVEEEILLKGRERQLFAATIISCHELDCVIDVSSCSELTSVRIVIYWANGDDRQTRLVFLTLLIITTKYITTTTASFT